MNIGVDDVWRMFIFLICLSCLSVLLLRRWENRNKWNAKTLDYWFSLVMWSLAGVILMIQGLIMDRPFTPALVFVSMAALVSARGLLRKGSWGGDDN